MAHVRHCYGTKQSNATRATIGNIIWIHVDKGAYDSDLPGAESKLKMESGQESGKPT